MINSPVFQIGGNPIDEACAIGGRHLDDHYIGKFAYHAAVGERLFHLIQLAGGIIGGTSYIMNCQSHDATFKRKNFFLQTAFFALCQILIFDPARGVAAEPEPARFKIEGAAPVYAEVRLPDAADMGTIVDIEASTRPTVERGQLVAAVDGPIRQEGRSRYIRVKLTPKGIPVGQYDGALRFIGPGNGVLASVPLAVTVKHGPLLPILTAMVGVGLGLVLTWYRKEGKQRDEMTIGEDRLRTDVLNDGALTNYAITAPFRDKINAELLLQRVEFRDGNWASAKERLLAATALYRTWVAEREAWLSALGRLERSRPEESNLGPLHASAEAFHRSVVDAAPSVGNAGAFSRRVESARISIDLAETVVTRLADLRELTQGSAGDSPVHAALEEIDAEILSTTGDDFNGPEKLKSILAKVITASRSEAVRLGGADGRGERQGSFSVMASAQADGPPPPRGLLFGWDPTPLAEGARVRLAWARRVIHAWGIAIAGTIALTVFGIRQLYVVDADFGTVWDYLALIAWGIGTESGSVNANEAIVNNPEAGRAQGDH